VALVDAVAASAAVAGIWPAVTIGGRRYVDGGFYSIDNADVAVGFERVLNLLDPAVRAPAAHAGREQGRRVASSRSF
jgi:NTE family protein